MRVWIFLEDDVMPHQFYLFSFQGCEVTYSISGNARGFAVEFVTRNYRRKAKFTCDCSDLAPVVSNLDPCGSFNPASGL